ncbi:MAG TPA: hypothetical protein VN827_08740 [Chthoniobacterales bacterium]|jgi:hypothetical protein|nr:hypothetical protein [Chthoniobacterales bacterium]
MTLQGKAISLILVLCLLGIAARTVVVLTDPLRRSDAEVREWLVKKTPLGSSFEEVRAVAIRDNWKIKFEYPFNAPSPFEGERLVKFDLGKYYSYVIPFHVIVTYRFTDDHLADIDTIERIGDSI